MKRLCLTLFLLAPVALYALDPVSIKMTKKTGSKSVGKSQTRRAGKSQSVHKDVYYEIELIRMDSKTPQQLIAKWVVFIEGVRGEVKPAKQGAQPVDLPFGKAVVMTTDEVELKSMEWTGRRDGDFGADIGGYGVQLYDLNNNLVAEKFSPSSIKKEMDELLEKQDDKQESVKEPRRVKKQRQNPVRRR